MRFVTLLWQLFIGGKNPQRSDTTEGAISNAVHPDVGMIQLGGHLVPMYFNYWNQHATSTQLLEREEWKKSEQ